MGRRCRLTTRLATSALGYTSESCTLNFDFFVRKHDPCAVAIKHAHQGSIASAHTLEFRVIGLCSPCVGSSAVNMDIHEDIIFVVVATRDLYDHFRFQRVPMVANGRLSEPATGKAPASWWAVFVNRAAAIAGTTICAPSIVWLAQGGYGQELAAHGTCPAGASRFLSQFICHACGPFALPCSSSSSLSTTDRLKIASATARGDCFRILCVCL